EMSEVGKQEIGSIFKRLRSVSTNKVRVRQGSPG
ncbi:hypothetical protein chiPu_0027091, partial [Chiloscyllium punctatum]|nr:hypothetical protein [Chiloscyllium punctatum]